MSLSKSQRGETTEGWNDCPPPMIRSRNASSSSLSKRRVYRVGSNLQDNSIDSTSSLKEKCLDQRSSSNLSLCDLQTRKSPKLKSQEVIFDDSDSQVIQLDHSVNLETVVEEFETFIRSPSKLSSKELDFYTNQIKKQLENLSSNHLQFLYQTIISKSENNTKLSIIEYMVVNDGVSSWCSPLKKLVESVL
jgi:hypothetical protein